MCGRFTVTIPLDIILQRFLALPLPGLEFQPSFNIAPTQSALVIVSQKERRVPRMMRWGLVPSWAKDKKIGNKLINARAETLQEKPTFRSLFRRRRCLVVADSFYEWKRVGNQKRPMRIMLKNNQPFAMAGLWDSWNQDGQNLSTFTIITTSPNELVESIHNRMPVILEEEHEQDWLSDPDDAEKLKSVLKPFDSKRMIAYEVSSLVNSPRNDSPECIQPVE